MTTYTINTKYSTLTGEVKKEQFVGGGLCLMLVGHDEDGYYFRERLNTNLDPQGLVADPDCIWVKTYSEHEGLAESMVEAGMVEMTGRLGQVGYGHFVQVKVLV